MKDHVWNMSASRRRHSEQLPLQRPLPDEVEPSAIRHGEQANHRIHRSHLQPHQQQQPLTRTRSSAHLFLGQLTGTCSSLFRRLSVKVRYLSLSLIPGSSGSRSSSATGGIGSSRPSTPPSGQRNRPRSADRVVEDIAAGQKVRPRRHTTTVCTTMDESTPVANHGPVNCSAAFLTDYRTARRSPSPGSDSEATPTPSPCTFSMPTATVEDTVYTAGQQHLRADDYPTLKGSSRRRRRHHHHHSSSGSSGGGGGNGSHNNNNNNHQHNRHQRHNRKSQTEASTGRDRASPLTMEDDGVAMMNSCATAADDDDGDHQLLNESTATPLALDQCFALGLNLTSLAPKSSKSTDTFLAGDQQNDDDDDEDEEEEEEEDENENDVAAAAAAGSSACDRQSEQVECELLTSQDNTNGSTAPNPYFDWFLSCNLQEEDEQLGANASVGDRRPSLKVSHKSVGSARGGGGGEEEEEEEDLHRSLEDLPYPILLDDWISPPSPTSPPAVALQHDHPSASMDRDPLTALRHHSTWFEDYAYPAYSSKSSQAGGASSSGNSSKSSNRLSSTGTLAATSTGTSRMMAEKAYPYVSTPATPSRHSNTKYHQGTSSSSSSYHLDPYDLLYDEVAYQVPDAAGLGAKLASSGGKPSTCTSNIIPVPLSSSSSSTLSSNNNSERGVHPGPESFPGVEPGTRATGCHGYGGPVSTSATGSGKVPLLSSSSNAAVGQSSANSSNAITRTVRTRRSQRLGSRCLASFFFVFLIPHFPAHGFIS